MIRRHHLVKDCDTIYAFITLLQHQYRAEAKDVDKLFAEFNRGLA
jgi:hypothetical protein